MMTSIALVPNQIAHEWKQPGADTAANADMPAVLVAVEAGGLDARHLTAHLKAQGYRVEVTNRVAERLAAGDGWEPTFLVLDLEAATQLPPAFPDRAPYRVVLVPAGSPNDAIKALCELGAVALLESPPHPGVLAATLDSLCRRFGCQSRRSRERVREGEEANLWRLHSRIWSLACPDGCTTELSHAETSFLLALAKSPGVAVARRDLIVALGHKPDYYDSRRLDTFVSRLRQKTRCGCGRPLPLRSIHAHGYAFASPILVED
jgi:DNA-binding response OmpR family regulator